MEAIAFDPIKGQLKFVKKILPRKPFSNEVLIRVAFAGVCGTDLHIVQGEFQCSSSEFVLGHEFSGIAEVVGENVTHITPGDKVVVDPNSGCHTCLLCTSGKYHLCNTKAINDTIGIFKDGGWATFCLVPGFQTYKVPEEITLEQAVLTEPFSCLAHGWNRISPVKVGQNILIQGAGIIGNLWATAFHLQGHKRVTLSEPIESRRKIAEKSGSHERNTYTIFLPPNVKHKLFRAKATGKWCKHSQKADENCEILILGLKTFTDKCKSDVNDRYPIVFMTPASILRSFCWRNSKRVILKAELYGLMMGTGYKCVDPSELKNFRADLIIDCSGSPGAIEFALNLLSPGGKLCIFGVAPPDSKIRISPYEIYKRELTIVGVMINPFTFSEAFGLMEAMGSKYLDYDRLGVQMFALKDFEAAFESLKSGKIAKAVFSVAK